MYTMEYNNNTKAINGSVYSQLKLEEFQTPMSQCRYMISLPNPNTDILNIISGIFYDLLCTGRAKIKQSVIVKQYFEGGLNMINLNAFSQAPKITWLRRMLQKESKWQILIKNCLYRKCFCCGSDYTESTLKNVKNIFWNDVLKALSNLQKHLNVDCDKSCPYQTPIFVTKIYWFGEKFGEKAPSTSDGSIKEFVSFGI